MSFLSRLFGKLFRKSNRITVDGILVSHRETVKLLKSRSSEMEGKSKRLAEEIKKVEKKKSVAELEQKRADIASQELGKVLESIDNIAI